MITTEDTTTTTTALSPAEPVNTTEDGRTQYEVSFDEGVCYFDQESGTGSTEWGFSPCDLTYDGEVVLIGTTTIAAPSMPHALPETGGAEGVMLVIASGIIAVGALMRRAAR